MIKFKHNKNRELYRRCLAASHSMLVFVCPCCSHEWQVVKEDEIPQEEIICDWCGAQGHQVS